MEPSQFTCPNCYQRFQADAAYREAVAMCPNCEYGEVNLSQTSSAPVTQPAGIGIAPNVFGVDIEENFDPRDLMKIDPMVRKRLVDLYQGAIVVVVLLVSLWLFETQVREKQKIAAPYVPQFKERDATVVRSKYSEAHQQLRNRVAKMVSSIKVANPEEMKALATLQEILTCQSSAQLYQLIRDRIKNKERFEAYYDKHPFTQDSVIGIQRSTLFESSEYLFHFDVIIEKDYFRTITLGRTAGGDYRFDWASYVGWSDMSWQEFLDEKPEEPKMFRVWAHLNTSKKDEPFLVLSHPADRSAPKIEVPLNRTDASDREVLFHFKTSTEDKLAMSVALKYEAPSVGARKRVMFDSLLATGWVMIDK